MNIINDIVYYALILVGFGCFIISNNVESIQIEYLNKAILCYTLAILLRNERG